MIKLKALHKRFGVIGIIGIFFTTISLLLTDDVGSRGIRLGEERLLDEARAFVESTKSDLGRFPTNDEFSAWKEASDENGATYEGDGFEYKLYANSDSFPEAIECYKGSNAIPFKFLFWNGEETLEVFPLSNGLYWTCSDSSNFYFGRPFPYSSVLLAIGACIISISLVRGYIGAQP
jgi:hypothetical protein